MHPHPRRLRVLVVDDCKDTARTYALLVTLWGHEALVAHDGPTALAMAREHRPDAVVLDIGLPGRTGWEVARELRRSPEFADVPLIAVSGYATEADRRRSVEVGLNAHLAKPADPEELHWLLEHPTKPNGTFLFSLRRLGM
ncbi:MAG TPA: response regulator [Gemmataceae bacterium]|nr:response regulator [Gemmataceae bacterium]